MFPYPPASAPERSADSAFPHADPRLAHHLAWIGAGSQILMIIAYAVLWAGVGSSIGAMDMTDANNMDLVLSEVNSVTRSLAVAGDRMVVVALAGMGALMAFIVALVKFQYRRRWAFSFSCLYGPFLMLLGLIHIPFGAFLLIYALIHRRDFAAGQAANSGVVQPV